MRDDGYVQPTRPQRIERREEELIMDAQAREVGLVLEAKTLLFAAEGGLPIDKANSPSDSGTRCKPECRTVSCGYSNFAIRDVRLSNSTPTNFVLPVRCSGIKPRKLPDPIEDSSARPPLKPRPSAIFHIASTTGFEV